MPHFTVHCAYADYLAATVTVEAATLEQAFEAAIAKADETEAWDKSDHSGDPFVLAVAEGEAADPWGADALPVPGRFTEAGEPPLVVVTGPAPAGGIRVAEGRARIRYVREAGTFTLDDAERLCTRLNARLGLDRDAWWAIVARSIGGAGEGRRH